MMTAVPKTSALASVIRPAALHTTIGLGTAHPLVIKAPIQPIEILTPTSLVGKIPGTIDGPPASALKPSPRPNALRPRVVTLSMLGGSSGGGGTNWPVPNGATLQDLANMGELNDYTIMTCLVRNTVTLLSQTNLFTDVENIWNGVVDEMKKDAAIGASVGVAVGVLDAALTGIGADILAGVIADLIAAIAAAITAAIQAVGISAFVGSVAAGGTFGYVGAIIGAVVGACIALGNLMYGGQHLSITDGRGFSCKDYVQTNVPQASKWLSDNPEKLVGLTAKRFAEQAALYLANPTWLYKNQRFTGMQQPAPPDPGSGDALDMVYTQVPGAFELLNRAQFAQAVTFVNASAGHLRDCASIPNPVPGQRKFYGDPNGTPYGTPQKGRGVWPDPTQTSYDDIYSTIILTWTIGECGGAHQMIPGTQTPAMWFAQYASCPNLTTNGNTYKGTWPDGQGKISGQTDPCPGIYALQVMFPTLTTVQCELIFDNATKTFGPVPSLMNTPAFAPPPAPLPPHPGPPPPPPGLSMPNGGHMASFGPTAAGLAAAMAATPMDPGAGMYGGSGYNPFGAASLLALNKGNPVAAAAAAQIASQKAGPSTAGGRILPMTPAEAVATITQIAQEAAGAGNLNAAQVQQMGQIARATVATTLANAKVGHPVAIYNAKVLDAAHKLGIASTYVGKYVTPTAAQHIVQNAGYRGLPLGSGKYDRNLPLVLEQTVDRMLNDPTATTADLQLFAACLVQAA